jgi:hypothetical protein
MFATSVTVVCRRRTINLPVVRAVTVSVLLLNSSSLILAAERDNPSLAQTLVQNPGRGKAPNAHAVSPMSRCMATWDPSTQMSKQVWRETCKRTVKEYPGLYRKAF